MLGVVRVRVRVRGSARVRDRVLGCPGWWRGSWGVLVGGVVVIYGSEWSWGGV